MKKRLMNLLRMPYEQKKLRMETHLNMLWASIQHARPFYKLAPLLGEQMQETSYVPNKSNVDMIRKVTRSINELNCYSFIKNVSLVRALIAMKMLERRKIECTLYLGTALDNSGIPIVHAWVRSGPYYVTGAPKMFKYNVVGMFAKTQSQDENKLEQRIHA